jgi:hypothetical protein
LSFDNQPLVPINSGTFDFFLTNGDVVRVTTTETPYYPLEAHTLENAPALGLPGIIAGLLLVGAIAAWRATRV